MFRYVLSRARLSRAFVATALVAFPGCDARVEDEPLAILVTPLEVPAAAGSRYPSVSTTEDVTWMSWLEPADEGGHDVWVAALGPAGWGPRRHVAYGDRFFVNWADFPSVAVGEDGRLWAHWLQRGGAGTYDYGVRMASSDDGGRSWSEPWTPHEDGTPTEHGFVSLFPHDGGIGAVWLDGRRTAPGPHGGDGSRAMTLRFRSSGPGGAGEEHLMDERVCDCCQTDVALAARGPVAVYRNRTEGEIRDIYVARWADGGWRPGKAVHDDGWEIAGCPVNGPAVAARGDEVAVAWFTGAEPGPRVQVAVSADGGETFGPPALVSDAQPVGRVDVMAREGGWLVSWLETVGEDAEVRLARIGSDGRVGGTAVVAATGAGRASGFPRMAPAADGRVVVVWTDSRAEPARVRGALVAFGDAT